MAEKYPTILNTYLSASLNVEFSGLYCIFYMICTYCKFCPRFTFNIDIDFRQDNIQESEARTDNEASDSQLEELVFDFTLENS